MPNSDIAGQAAIRAFNERRADGRPRSLKGGLLRFNRGYGTMECVVRDFSDAGARLVFGEAVAVPARFELRIGTDGAWRPALVRWRRDDQVGVSFG
jgi:hypothetical protein